MFQKRDKEMRPIEFPFTRDVGHRLRHWYGETYIREERISDREAASD